MSRLAVGSLIVILISFFFYFDGQSYLSISFIQSQLETFRDAFREKPLVIVGAYFGLYVLVTALSLPGATVMTLLGGAVFGLLWGTLIVSFASTIGATLAFLIARLFLHDWVKSRFRKRYERAQREFERQGGFYVFSIRLVPLVPFFVANLVLALTPVRLVTYYVASQIGMLPGTLVYVNAGQQLGQLESFEGIFTPSLIAAFLILAAFPWFSKGLLSWIRAKRTFSKFKRPKKFDYQTVVIGGGSAGLVASSLTASLQGKVALVEKHKMGGDCLHTGCVPSKTLIRSARLAHHMKQASKFGFKNTSFEVDFPQLMRRVHSVIETIQPHDSVERYESLGVDCYQQEAKILSPFEVQVGEHVLRTKHIIIATGAQPRVMNFPWLDPEKILTSDNLWSLQSLPHRLLIVGGGAIGCELAQSFARLGSRVTIMERGSRLLSKEDPDVSKLIEEIFRKEDIDILFETELKSPDQTKEYDFVLFALGRVAQVKGFGLENLEVQLRENGTIETNEFLQTRTPNVWACGDVTGPFQFTHMAGHQGSIAALNALMSPFKKFRWQDQEIPWVTYTDPEVAHIGWSEADATERELPFEIHKFSLQKSDRALTEGETEGFVKVLVEKGTDKVLGATIVGERAGEMIPEFSLVMKSGHGLKKILSLIHSYPTWNEANKSVALEWRRQRIPKWAMSFLKEWNKWRLNA